MPYVFARYSPDFQLSTGDAWYYGAGVTVPLPLPLIAPLVTPLTALVLTVNVPLATLNVRDPETLFKLIRAIVRQENGYLPSLAVSDAAVRGGIQLALNG